MSRRWNRCLVAGLILFTAFSIPVFSQNLPDGLYAEISTVRGDIIVELDFRRAPLTVTNFIGLAEGRLTSSRGMGTPFYDGLTFHRVVEEFVIQGGDPAGNGTGGPGYRFPDEFNPELRHDRPGTLSMANSGPHSNGSQFFITLDETPWLDDRHSVFGYVVQGQRTVDAIRQGDAIESIVIIRRGEAALAFQGGQSSFDRLVEEAREAIAEEAARRWREALRTITRRWPDAEATQSGIYYVIDRPGDGDPIEAGDTVTLHYEAYLLDAQQPFESTRAIDPVTAVAGAGRLLPGWEESLLMMRVGERRTIILPPELAFGNRSVGTEVPPNAFIVFDIEILSVSP